MEIDNHRQKFDVTKRFTSGKLQTLSGARPPQSALPRAASKLTPLILTEMSICLACSFP